MNIIIVSPGNPILIDLGTARFFDEKIEKEEVVMSMPYSPSELLSGDPIDGRVDIYSLGMTLLHMLAGQKTMYTEDDYDWDKLGASSMPIFFDVSERPTSAQLKLYIEDRLKQVAPLSLKSVVRKALSQNPSDRYCDANEFRLAVMECNKDV